MGYKKPVNYGGVKIGDVEEFGSGFYAWLIASDDYVTTTIQGPLAGWITMAFPVLEDAVQALIDEHVRGSQADR